MKGQSKSPLNSSLLSQSFNHSFTNQSQRDRSPVPSLDQILAEKMQAINDF